MSTASSPLVSRRFRVLRAYRLVVRVLFSYGLVHVVGFLRGPDWKAHKRMALHRRNAERVVATIQQLQGLFIKVGQLISILTNFLPQDFRQALETLQDQIPARPLDEIHGRIRHAFGQEVDVLFASFNPVPIASASLAQVHEAYLHDGRRVAVKVQHRDIEAVAQLDLRTIRRIVGLLGIIIRVRGLHTQYDQVEATIWDELDFTKEAEHLETIAAHFSDQPDIGFPEVIHECSGKHVLTTTFVEGTKITHADQLDVDRTALAERIVQAYCDMIFRDGLYHADPHPGNLLVRPDSQLVFIDFGAVARLSPAMKSGLASLVMAFIQQDSQRITEALNEIGFVAHGNHEATVTKLISQVQALFLDTLDFNTFQLQDLDADTLMAAKMNAFTDFSKLDISLREMMNTFQVPKDVILLLRTLVLLMGLCTHLNPTMNPLLPIRRYVETMMQRSEWNWQNWGQRILKEMALTAFALPKDLQRLAHTAQRGDLRIRIPEAQLIYRAGHQLLYGFLSFGLGAFAYVVHLNADVFLSQALLAGCGFFGLCLGGSLWRARALRLPS